MAKDTLFEQRHLIPIKGFLKDFSTPQVMGIVNLTPDSFYPGGRNKDNWEASAERHINEGAQLLDLGGQSTRPNAKLLSPKEEWERIKTPLKSLVKKHPNTIISVDTFWSEVAEKAIGEGADIINDISGGTMDENMFSTIAKLKVPYILMHIQGTPQTMQKEPTYENVTKEVIHKLSQRLETLLSLGANDVIIDPGFGFGKTLKHNFQLLGQLDLFKIFERPLLVGFSRKSMIYKTLGNTAEEALNGTTASNTMALMKGANILRVHDVKPALETTMLFNQTKPQSWIS